jgi:hypothetical protein
MGQALSRMTTELAAPAAPALYKPDRPRAIDRHIAFFGDQAASARDMCGEALLDALTGAEPEIEEASSCD